MKRTLILFAAICIMAGPAFAKELKIGVINMQLALNQCAEGKKVLDKMKDNLAKEQDIITKKQDELKKMDDELKTQGYMMTDAVRKEKEQKLRKLTVDFDRYKEDKQNEFVSQQRDATARIYNEIAEVVDGYAKENGYTVVFELASQTPGMPGTLIYSDEAIDITKKVIDIYNAKK